MAARSLHPRANGHILRVQMTGIRVWIKDISSITSVVAMLRTEANAPDHPPKRPREARERASSRFHSKTNRLTDYRDHGIGRVRGESSTEITEVKPQPGALCSGAWPGVVTKVVFLAHSVLFRKVVRPMVLGLTSPYARFFHA